MNRINQSFKKIGDKKAFIAFITGGDPDIETTEKLIITLAESGVDIIEIGIPFSDPVAEGIVIQSASERALANGFTVDKLFEMVKRVRRKIDIPLLFMTYINPIFGYGKERFMKNCFDCGIDGVIVPDLPFEEKEELSDVCAEHGICQISMISPTSLERTLKIAKEAEGFLYCVSSLGVTGMRSKITTNIPQMIQHAKQATAIPCMVGFGISNPEQAREMAAVSDGVIIGSAIVKIIAEHGRQSIEPVKQFAEKVRAALNRG